MNLLNTKYFLISLAFGILCCYLFVPTPKIIFSTPTPDKVHSLVYKDEDKDSCYKLEPVDADCSIHSINLDKN